MRILLLSIVLALIFPTVILSQESKSSQNSWLNRFNTPEVIVTLGIPIGGALAWILKDYVRKDQELGRRLFKEEIVDSLNNTIREIELERREMIDERLKPLQYALQTLVNELKQGKLEDKELKQELDYITEEIGKINTRIEVQETKLESIIESINAEVSSILTAYLKDPVRVNLFCRANKNDKS
jgi:septal ring factor EnvC (AmiA/AmiB activator)